MDILISSLAAITLFVSSITGVAVSTEVQPLESVELGLSETSPLGEQGGFAMPASGCSAADPQWHGGVIHDCAIRPDISADQPIVRLGDPVTISWDPRTHTNCMLSSNLTSLSPEPDGEVAGSRELIPTGESTYSIICDGVGNGDAVTVKVLPRFQET